MIDFLKRKIGFLIFLFMLLLSGIYGGKLSYVVIPLGGILLYRKGKIFEVFATFLTILILSDSRHSFLSFAADIKNIYLPLMLLFAWFDKTSALRMDNSFAKSFLLFFLVAFLCLLLGETFFVSFQKTISYLLLLLMVPTYITAMYRDNGKTAFTDLVYFLSVFLFLGLVFKFSTPLFVSLGGRFTGMLGNPNGLGLFVLLLFLFFSVVKKCFTGSFSRNNTIYLYVLIFASLVLCQSRSSLIAVIIFLFFSYFYRMSPVFGFLIFVFILILYQVISENIVPIIVSLGLDEYFRIDTFESGSGRLIAWEFAWRSIQENIILGRGMGFTDYFFKKNYSFLSMLGHQGNAHNSYLTFWLDTGIFGLFSYLVAFVSVFIKGNRKVSFAIPIMYSVLFSAYFESWLTASLNPFTILVFLIATLLIYFDEFNEIVISEKVKPMANIHNE